MANVAPLAPTLIEPDNNEYSVGSWPIVFTWVFNDPGDTQSRTDLRYKKLGDGAWTTLANITTTAHTFSLPSGTWTTLVQHEWQLSTFDSAGLQSPWSSSRFTNIVASMDPPAVTSPTNGATVTATPLALLWDLPVGFSQQAYQISATENNAGAAVLYDSGDVESVAQTALVPLPVMTGFAVILRVRFRSNGLWSFPGQSVVENAILPPPKPLIVCAQTPGMRPEVVISITNPAASDAGHLATVSNDIARNGVPIAKDLPPGATFTDHLPGAGAVTYVCTAKTANGGTAQSY